MRMIRQMGPILAAGLLCGCLQVNDELTLQPDGSGTVRLETRTAASDELTSGVAASSLFGGSGERVYPPLNDKEARLFFPANAFSLKVDEQSAGEGKVVSIEAAFKDINALLASPYGRAHQLAVRVEGGSVLLRARHGGEAVARVAESAAAGGSSPDSWPGLEDLAKKKGELRFAFRVTLPNPIAAANGIKDGKTAAWAADRASCQSDAAFSDRMAGVLEAGCDADGVSFAPVTPPRLGLLPFAELAAGTTSNAVPAVDTNKIAAAARFVPCALHVTRSVDLSGEGSGRESRALLVGAVVLPADLAPPEWGTPKLEEVVDAKGRDLMLKEEDEGMARIPSVLRHLDGRDAEEEEEDVPRKSSAEERHEVVLTFRAPEWNVKEIARIRGVVPLQYFGASEVVKLSHAVPASLVADVSKPETPMRSLDSARGPVTDARLTELGLSVQVQMAVAQSGMTMISLETAGEASLTDAQVFDNDGHPWPTTLVRSDAPGGEERSHQLMVAGRPKPPFSLGLLVSRVGAVVPVPVLLEKVPVSGP